MTATIVIGEMVKNMVPRKIHNQPQRYKSSNKLVTKKKIVDEQLVAKVNKNQSCSTVFIIKDRGEQKKKRNNCDTRTQHQKCVLIF